MKFIRRNRFKLNKIKLLSIKITDCGRTLTENGKKKYEEKRRNQIKPHTTHTAQFIHGIVKACSILKAKRKWPMFYIKFHEKKKYTKNTNYLFGFFFICFNFIYSNFTFLLPTIDWKQRNDSEKKSFAFCKMKVKNFKYSTIGFDFDLAVCIELESVLNKKKLNMYWFKWMEMANLI